MRRIRFTILSLARRGDINSLTPASWTCLSLGSILGRAGLSVPSFGRVRLNVTTPGSGRGRSRYLCELSVRHVILPFVRRMEF